MTFGITLRGGTTFASVGSMVTYPVGTTTTVVTSAPTAETSLAPVTSTTSTAGTISSPTGGSALLAESSGVALTETRVDPPPTTAGASLLLASAGTALTETRVEITASDPPLDLGGFGDPGTTGRRPGTGGTGTSDAGGLHPRLLELTRPLEKVTAGIRKTALSRGGALGSVALIEIPTSILPPLRELSRYSDDSLDVSEARIENGNFSVIERDSLTRFRPEIITVSDFHSIWQGSPKDQVLSPVGKLADVQYNALILRRDTLINLMRGLARRETFAELQRLRVDFRAALDDMQSTITTYGQFLDNIESARQGLDIKKIPPSRFGVAPMLSLVDFFERHMQFDRAEFTSFSDTKILMQLLIDLKATIEDYSFSLLNISDSDRVNDRNPTRLDKSYSLNDGFSFTVEQIRSPSTTQNATELSFFNLTLNSLPSEPDDRIKLLLHLVSKELRVSKALGNPSVQSTLRSQYNVSKDTNPFDNIIGVPGNTIFDPVSGEDSLASLFTLEHGTEDFVLPFEQKYVDLDGTKVTYIPGSTYLVDSVLDVSDESSDFNTRPFVEYATTYGTITKTASEQIETLLDLEPTLRSVLLSHRLYDRYLDTFKSCLIGVVDRTALDNTQALYLALFKLSDENNALKNLLFQFALLAGLAANRPEDRRSIFTTLAAELRTVSSFPGVRVTRGGRNPNLLEGMTAIRPFLEQLAESIEQLVFSLVAPSPSISRTPGLRDPDGTEFSRSTLFGPRRSTGAGILSEVELTGFRTTSVPGDDTSNLEFRRGQVKQVLLDSLTVSTTIEPNKGFITLVSDYYQLYSDEGQLKVFLEDNSGRTRFNFLSTSTQLLLLFEAWSSLATKYSFVELAQSSTTSKLVVAVRPIQNEIARRAVSEVLAKSMIIEGVVPSTRAEIGGGSGGTGTTDSGASALVSSMDRFLGSTTLRVTGLGDYGGSVDSGTGTSAFAALVGSSGGSSVTTDSAFTGAVTLGTGGGGGGGDLSLGSLLTSTVTLTPEILATFRVDLPLVRLRLSLMANRTKLIQESVSVRNILQIFRTIGQTLTETQASLLFAFNPRTFSTFLARNTLDELKLSANPAQVRVSAHVASEYREASTALLRQRETGLFAVNNLLNDRIIRPEVRDALFSLLSERMFVKEAQSDTQIKLITVGLPAGLSKFLADRIERSQINEKTFEPKQFDVVKVLLHKRDVRYDDIVFKPQEFIFDLSMFISLNSSTSGVAALRPGEFESFERLLDRIQLIDYESITVRKFRDVADVLSDDKYRFLSPVEARSMVRNHLTSVLLELYTSLVTGMSINESTFPALPREQFGTEINERFLQVVFRYFRDTLGKPVPNLPIPQLLTSPDVEDDVKDALRLIVFGDSLFEPPMARSIALTPRVFDRVFHLAFNTELFELDLDKTLSTHAGKVALRHTFVQERLAREGDRVFFRPKESNELRFEDYFVVISNEV